MSERGLVWLLPNLLSIFSAIIYWPHVVDFKENREHNYYRLPIRGGVMQPVIRPRTVGLESKSCSDSFPKPNKHRVSRSFRLYFPDSEFRWIHNLAAECARL